jgi:prophage regulatory protein
MTDTMLRLPDVLKRTGLKRSTFYSRIASGELPPGIPLGLGVAVGWRESDVDAWILAQIRSAGQEHSQGILKPPTRGPDALLGLLRSAFVAGSEWRSRRYVRNGAAHLAEPCLQEQEARACAMRLKREYARD